MLGVVSDLRTAGPFHLQLRSLVRAMSLTVGPDPLLGWSFLVNRVELLLIRAGFVGSFGSGSRKHVSADNPEIANKLAEFRVGDEKSDKYAEVRGGCDVVRGFFTWDALLTLVGIRVDLVLADGKDTGLLGTAGVATVRGPDGVLE